MRVSVSNHPHQVLIPVFRAALVLGLISLVATACNASRISGTYVAHGPDSTEMLQLTQTDNGQVSGVFSFVKLKDEGTVSSEQMSVTGTIDADQLTLSIRSGFLPFLGGTSFAGTANGSTIRLQIVDSKGNVASDVFVRGTPADFKAYTDRLKSKGEGIVLNRKLLNGAQDFRQTVRKAEDWISNAELHAQRIPTVKGRYQKIEDKMESLVTREHSIANSSAKAELSGMVSEGYSAGIEIDNEVNYLWDMQIQDSGIELYKVFKNWDGNCGSPDELRERQKRGATEQAIKAWESACKETIAEREKFAPIFKRVMEQRTELKSFQATSEAHRKALVNEANRIY